jgi:hypothetical protein
MDFMTLSSSTTQDGVPMMLSDLMAGTLPALLLDVGGEDIRNRIRCRP